jgi:hypothetical protein
LRHWKISSFDEVIWVLARIFHIPVSRRKNRLFDGRKRALQRAVVRAVQCLGQPGLHSRHFLRACRLAADDGA